VQQNAQSYFATTGERMTHKIMIPAHALVAVKEIVEKGIPATSLESRGIAESKRTAQLWVKAYREGNYKTFTSPGHRHTGQDEYSPSRALQDYVSSQQLKYQALLQEYSNNNDDVYIAITSDWHLPDHNPVAMELARLVSQAWLSGNQNALHIINGDIWDLPTMGRFNNNVPFWMLYPECNSPEDYMMVTMHHTDLEMKAWMDVAQNHLLITGNHDIRFIRYVFTAAPHIASWGTEQFMQQVSRSGITWLGNGVSRLVMSKYKTLILHGEFARKGAGNSIRAQAEAEAYFYDLYIQSHVHRLGNFTRSRGDGSQVRGYEMGCIQNLQPLYTDRTQDWQHGIMLMCLSRNSAFPEVINVPFEECGKYLCARLDGNEFRVEIPGKHIDMRMKRRGIFDVQTSMSLDF
jgi:hypothetical protein